jgi:hypothetical protein
METLRETYSLAKQNVNSKHETNDVKALSGK